MKNKAFKVDNLSQRINEHIGAKIGQRRTKLGYSQAYVGKRIGRSGELVRQVENALTTPSPGTLAAMSRVLKVNINYFFDGFKIANDDKYSNKQLQRLQNYILCIDDITINISTGAKLSLKKNKQHLPKKP